MIKKIKQSFLFLIPTLIVALVFILFDQQNIFITADSDSDIGALKIESLAKHLNYNSSPLIFYTQNNENTNAPILTSNGDMSIFAFTVSCENNMCGIKNRSPPKNTTVI